MAETLDELFVAAGGQPHLIAQATRAAAKQFADAIATIQSLTTRQKAVQQAAFEGHRSQMLREVDEAGKAAHPVGSPASELQLRTHGAACESWDNQTFWSQYVESTTDPTVGIPRLIRIGVLADHVPLVSGQALSIEVPALLPVLGHGGVVLSGTGAPLESAREALCGILLRLLAALPSGRLRLTLVDHAHKGRAFTNLLKLHKTILGDMVWHEPRDIDEALKGLIEHTSTIIQKYLTNQYPDLEAYNAAAVDVGEPYRVLAIADFPAGFDQAAAERVLSIARNGRSVGVYVVLTLDTKVPVPHGFNLSELERVCTVLRVRDGHFRWEHPVLGRGLVNLDPPPPQAVVDGIVEQLSRVASQAEQVKVLFTRFVPPTLWQESTRGGIKVPIGRRGARDDQNLELGHPQGTAHHALIAGRTGMGKSVLLHSLIIGACLRYAPSELELYLVDFKEGVEFEPYRRLPHARVVAIESEREFAVSVLEGIREEFSVRTNKFKKAGVNTFAEFRKISAEPMPRILLLVDEFQIFFERNDRLASSARAILDDIARRGRGFGVHEILASQTVSSGVDHDLESTTLAQMGLRIALALSESDSYKVLSRDNDAARHLERPGEAIYNDKAGHVGGNNRFQVAFLGRSEIDKQLDGLVAQAGQAGLQRQPFVFEGSSKADIGSNPELVALRTTRPTSLPRAVSLFLGEPATMQPRHPAFKLRRQSRSNLLIIGQAEAETLSVFLSALVSFSLGVPAQSAVLYVLNLANVDDPLHDHVDVCKDFDQSVQLGGRAQVAKIIDTVHDLLRKRVEQSQGTESSLSPVLLAIFGLQRARDMFRDGLSVPDASKRLARILRDGPDFGIHSIVAVDTFAGLLRCLEQKDLNEFDGRAVLSGGDANRVLGEHAPGFKIKPRYGVLFEPETPDLLRKFKCYDLSLLDWYRKQLTRKTTHV